MEEVVQKRNRKGRVKARAKTYRHYSKSFKVRIVKMHEEEDIALHIICSESGVPGSTVTNWIRKYRHEGESGLEPTPRCAKSEVHPAVTEKIISVKKDNPAFGVRRITAALRRWFFLPVNSGTVSRTLSSVGMNTPAPRRRSSNVQKPRRFERSTPNQMWQSDIMMFRMGGRQVYLVGFVDDYSRFITGLSLCMAQTADNVLELYRKATAEHGVPKEMLTDNGRQYVNWRGESKFQKELQKDRVKHIRSSPHHPMTLGKIERFWQTIFDEFLSKAQFESFESAQERVRLWVQYYNHKRPHQGIESLCPADRYFEVATEVRRTIEAGVKENALELALRGKPREPFYLVGRMDGQAVVLRAQKGKLKLTVDDALKPSCQEHEFTIDKEKRDEQRAARAFAGGITNSGQEQGPVELKGYSDAEGGGGTQSVGGTQQPVTDLPGNEHYMDYIKPLAGACDGRDASGAGTLCTVGQGLAAESAFAGFAEETERVPPAKAYAQVAQAGEERTISGRMIDGGTDQGAGTFGGYSEGVVRADDSNRRGEATERLTQELLRVAGPGACRDEGCADRPAGGQTVTAQGCGEGETAGAGRGAFQSVGTCPQDDRSEEHTVRLRSAAEIAFGRIYRAG